VYHFEEVYYSGQNCGAKTYNPLLKAKDGDEGYPWVKGDHVAYRYELVEVLGEGSFGQVYKVLDHKNNKAPMALKMVKFNDKYLTQARI
jgi:serine/threonine protein kinase